MQNLITQIVEFSKKINSSEVKGKNFELFVKEFYHENKLTDFESYSTEALCNFAISSFKFLNFESIYMPINELSLCNLHGTANY